MSAKVPDLEGVDIAAGANGERLGEADFAVVGVDDDLCFI